MAREKELSGWILTSNGSRAHLDRLVAEAGAERVTVLKITEAQAAYQKRRAAGVCALCFKLPPTDPAKLARRPDPAGPLAVGNP